jgi:SWI/SNF-related matrix-associated actin-dependent regulator of chromatin subfamily A member 5
MMTCYRNPQADLQAQDRAHRIGQKRPVQVFRLVTDDTVEVKVVERAQQKLKLDAMVVQQGRLQEKEKKLSKTELLETIRFGADKIFRSKESTITDDDIDMILEQGRLRTIEMNEKLQIADKGELYDFRLDGGMKSQVFEGKDYSDKNQRESDQNFMGFAFIDPGKRERRPIATYSETVPRATVDEADKKPKLPRNLRLPRMEDWQFYDKGRLQALQEEELRLFDAFIAERGDQSNGLATKIVSLLPPELHQEKNQLLREAFDWTRVQFNNFVRASAKHGRSEFEKIAKDIHKSVEETIRYAETFWSRGMIAFPPSEWDRIVKSIEKVSMMTSSMFT